MLSTGIKAAAMLALSAVASAGDAPQYDGFSLSWSDNWSGDAGSFPNEGTWNIIEGDLGINGELEYYARSSRNVQLSGGGTLQLVPWRDPSAPKGWTSGRIESKYVFTPQPGKLTRVESVIQFGKNDINNKYGLWPAFWMLGDSLRNGGGWPACGELDIMEQVDGYLTGYGTMHCDQSPGGICNEGQGIGASTGIPNQDWHVWRIEIDNRDGNWQNQAITWFLDDHQYHQITGARIGNENVWNSVAHSGLYVIFNYAVGGDWPKYPNDQTQDGYGSMMEVGYVAHYTSN